MEHLLDGCRAKIDRAKEIIGVLELEYANFAAQPSAPFTITREHRGSDYVFIASGDSQAPLRFSILAGEVIHHLRSSLDHLISAIVIAGGGTPTGKHQHPICTTEENFDLAIRRKQLDGVSASVAKIIRDVQPFMYPTPENTVLAVIAEYNNADKHRLLIVVNAAMELGEEIRVGADLIEGAPVEEQHKEIAILGFSSPMARPISPEGEVVFSIQLREPTPNFFANVDLVPTLVFKQSGLVKGAPVVPTLNNMCLYVREYIEFFADAFRAQA